MDCLDALVSTREYRRPYSLEEAIRLTGLFIKDGPVVQVKDYRGAIEQEKDPDPSVLYDGPLVVLTSRFSAARSAIKRWTRRRSR